MGKIISKWLQVVDVPFPCLVLAEGIRIDAQAVSGGQEPSSNWYIETVAECWTSDHTVAWPMFLYLSKERWGQFQPKSANQSRYAAHLVCGSYWCI